MKKIITSICLVIVCISIPLMAHAFTPIAGNALVYSGGQNDTKIYSIVEDRKNPLSHGMNDDGKNFAVLAIVKVGSNTYTSGWKIASANKYQDRVWYANESSGFDYKTISTEYTYNNWGTTY